MGASASAHQRDTYAKNDYELVIRAQKHLEHIMVVELGGSGASLHENISSLASLLPSDLVRRLRYIATLRNKIVHDAAFDALPDRERFISELDASIAALNNIVAHRERDTRHASGAPLRQDDTTCIVC